MAQLQVKLIIFIAFTKKPLSSERGLFAPLEEGGERAKEVVEIPSLAPKRINLHYNVKRRQTQYF